MLRVVQQKGVYNSCIACLKRASHQFKRTVDIVRYQRKDRRADVRVEGGHRSRVAQHEYAGTGVYSTDVLHTTAPVATANTSFNSAVGIKAPTATSSAADAPAVTAHALADSAGGIKPPTAATSAADAATAHARSRSDNGSTAPVATQPGVQNVSVTAQHSSVAGEWRNVPDAQLQKQVTMRSAEPKRLASAASTASTQIAAASSLVATVSLAHQLTPQGSELSMHLQPALRATPQRDTMAAAHSGPAPSLEEPSSSGLSNRVPEVSDSDAQHDSDELILLVGSPCSDAAPSRRAPMSMDATQDILCAQHHAQSATAESNVRAGAGTSAMQH